MTSSELWAFLPVGYVLTVGIETPVLLIGLSSTHHWPRRLWYGLWLTACTYPIVVLTLYPVMAVQPRWQYLLVAETFAPLVECLLFWLSVRNNVEAGQRPSWLRDLSTIAAANLASFSIGELAYSMGFKVGS